MNDPIDEMVWSVLYLFYSWPLWLSSPFFFVDALRNGIVWTVIFALAFDMSIVVYMKMKAAINCRLEQNQWLA